MDHETEVIKQQMEETRSSLQDKLSTLESQVKETVQTATDAVSTVKETVEETVGAVKESVHDTVASVKESVHDTVDAVKDTFDVRHQVERHPWGMFLGAAAVGFVGGHLLHRLMAPPQPALSYAPAYTPAPTYEHFYRDNGSTGGVTSSNAGAVPTTPPAPPPQQAAPRHSWVNTLMEHYGPEINQLKGLAIGTLGAVVRQMVAEQAPPPLADPIKQMVDGVTEKLGGRRIEGPIFETSGETNGSHGQENSGVAGMTGRDPVVGRYDM